METSTRIAPDVVETILDAIGPNDISTLKAFALTCIAFCDVSQRRIFESVKIYSNWNGDKGLDALVLFQSALRSSPHLTGYVRQLSILDWSNNSIIYNHPTLPDTLGMLHKVNHFSFGDYYRCHEWSRLSPSLKQALVSILLLPTIKKVELYGLLYIPIALGDNLERIPSLTITKGLSNSFSETDNLDITPLLRNAPTTLNRCLQNLVVEMWVPRVERDLRVNRLTPPYSKLETLTVRTSTSGIDIGFVTELLMTHKETLTVLTSLILRSVGEINIGTLPHLHTIGVHTELGSPHFTSAATILEKARPDNKVQEIIIYYEALHMFKARDIVDPEGLDSMLTSPQFSHLKKITFFMTSVFAPWMVESSIMNISAYFPKTISSGKMWFDSDHDVYNADEFLKLIRRVFPNIRNEHHGQA